MKDTEKEHLDEKDLFLGPFKNHNVSLGELKPDTSCCAWFGFFWCGTKVQLVHDWRSCELRRVGGFEFTAFFF